MDDDVADGMDGGDASSAAAQEANGIAFLLASAAYLTLADAHLRREGPEGLALMDEIEDRITEALRSFVEETSYEDARPDILQHATRKVRALLDAGRSLAPEMRRFQ
ncbi:hypothetical protein ABID82_003257 [Methylobacterium sp. PvP062]|jgi:hypothetical protein|uniref:Uncharacterized protein n=2 Tax=Methylobacterium radiotolerans TaxID=31998 RepID=B1LT73_METRJ|nr:MULTISPECIES: hypothetical protein [Methylobacterium]MBE7202473.1 hypothetical protein [Parafilimonas terrae]MCX7335645.1 hypothetical protein [Hyphomicrobiales bacterium]GAN46121.1 LPXTG cell wall surface protein [Methylobacterium sp. ME121]ACB22379.1 hypothetical protein Mrad2831_0356 [Methylobacterium radiotolerans JCM 2831]KTS10494.1 hypothetical protein SB3_07305 [Methylobacterium radiotolerans]